MRTYRLRAAIWRTTRDLASTFAVNAGTIREIGLSPGTTAGLATTTGGGADGAFAPSVAGAAPNIEMSGKRGDSDEFRPGDVGDRSESADATEMSAPVEDRTVATVGALLVRGMVSTALEVILVLGRVDMRAAYFRYGSIKL